MCLFTSHMIRMLMKSPRGLAWLIMYDNRNREKVHGTLVASVRHSVRLSANCMVLLPNKVISSVDNVYRGIARRRFRTALIADIC
jgi:hypothetical protein